jgi:hypothetical protein
VILAKQKRENFRRNTGKSYIFALKYMFGISYYAIKRSTSNSTSNNDIRKWIHGARRYNYLSNKTLLEWASPKTQKKMCNNSKFSLEAMVEILNCHFQYRMAIYKACDSIGLNNRVVFIFVSLFMAYYCELRKLLTRVLSLRFEYEKLSRTSKDCVIAIGFPEHSFTVGRGVRSGDFRLISSFGEYLTDRYGSGSEVEIVSFNEYIRVSKEKDSVAVDFKKNIRPYPRKIVKKYTGIGGIFKGLSMLINFTYNHKYGLNKSGLLMKLIYFRRFASEVDVQRMLSSVDASKKNLKAIYVLPYSDTGLIKYDTEYSEKVTVYSYSDNTLIPVMRNAYLNGSGNLQTDCQKVLADMPFTFFLLDVKSVGFDGQKHKIYKAMNIINSYYGRVFTITDVDQKHQKPMLLGYESEFELIRQQNKINVGVFDLPPTNKWEQLSWYYMGYDICSFDVVKEFIEEVVDACVSQGFNVIFKSKYSVKKYNNEYARLLDGIVERYPDSVILVDPYLKFESLIGSMDMTVTMPYSSPKVIGDSCNIPSIYYLPERFKSSFNSCDISNDLIFGKDSLIMFLKERNTYE